MSPVVEQNAHFANTADTHVSRIEVVVAHHPTDFVDLVADNSRTLAGADETENSSRSLAVADETEAHTRTFVADRLVAVVVALPTAAPVDSSALVLVKHHMVAVAAAAV